MLALSRAQVPQLAFLRRLIEEVGSAKELLENASHIQDIVPDATPKLVSLLTDRSLVELAEREMEFIEKNNIKLICMGDKAYPCRLAECDDAPLVLHSMGNADLNAEGGTFFDLLAIAINDLVAARILHPKQAGAPCI